MRNIYRILLLMVFGSLVLMWVNLNAQSAGMNMITKAIKNGDAHELSLYFNKSVNVRINKTEGMYSRVQAEQMFVKFFQANKPVWFEIKGKGDLSATSQYIIASYVTNNDRYRVYVMVKGAVTQEICQISFRKDQ